MSIAAAASTATPTSAASTRGKRPEPNRRNRSTPHSASSTPAPPPSAASMSVSVSRRRTRRARPAPSAVWIAISRRRPTARARSRLVRLAQATSSTRRTAPPSTRSRRRASGGTTASASGCRSIAQPPCVSGNVAPRKLAVSCRPFSTFAGGTPARRRANTSSMRRDCDAVTTRWKGTSRSAPSQASMRGMTPTIVTGWPSTVTTRPTTSGSPPNWRSHSPWPRTATGAGAPTRVSSAWSPRPSTGRMPVSAKKPASTCQLRTVVGVSMPPRLARRE